MSAKRATFNSVNSRRALPRGAARRTGRAIGSSVVLGVGAVAAVGLLVTVVTVSAAWILNSGLASHPRIHAKAMTGPGTLGLANADPRLASASPNFEPKWARASVAAKPMILDVPDDQAKRYLAQAPVVTRSLAPIAVAVLSPKIAVERVDSVPLPPARPHQAQREAFGPPIEKFTPQVAAIAPAAPPATEKRVVSREDRNKVALPAELGDRTAVYDISARAVFLPSGEKLEAHSGLGDKMDNPRFVHIRMRGATPPNVYDLRLREQLFHGVRAIRLTPVHDDKMFGRDGMLAHSYLLGPNGQSHGCVSFKDYEKFLQAFLKGEIDRLIVVPEGGTQLALAVRERRGQVKRYASSDPLPDRNPGVW